MSAEKRLNQPPGKETARLNGSQQTLWHDDIWAVSVSVLFVASILLALALTLLSR